MYDAIVVGAGIEGSATAYNLAKRGKKVLLIEQYPLLHPHGSSTGLSRSTRKTYGAQEYYTRLMGDAYKMTEELEHLTGQNLFNVPSLQRHPLGYKEYVRCSEGVVTGRNCCNLTFAPKDHDYLRGAALALRQNQVQHEVLDAREQTVLPNIRVPDNFEFILDKSGGILRADKILQSYQTLFLRHGGVIHDRESVMDILPGRTVRVKTDKAEYVSNSVVLTLGPWAPKFLPRLGIRAPLKTLKISVLYWREKTPGEFLNSPSFYECDAIDGHGVYGLPSVDYPGLIKICLHHGSEVDPDKPDTEDNAWAIDKMKAYVASRFPTVKNEPEIIQRCLYTMTPDEDFILDTHPQWKNLVIGTGFSGHGFKLAPVVGHILADLATGTKCRYDLTPFKLNRFTRSKL